jgi:ferritin-like metal-binding protein YciE
MSAYRSTHLLATTLGYDAVADLLQETLDEEIAAAETLEAAAEGGLFSTGLADKAAADEDDLAVK